jgi:hypothetical protein
MADGHPRRLTAILAALAIRSLGPDHAARPCLPYGAHNGTGQLRPHELSRTLDLVIDVGQALA